jgi:hypothetical protein
MAVGYCGPGSGLTAKNSVENKRHYKKCKKAPGSGALNIVGGGLNTSTSYAGSSRPQKSPNVQSAHYIYRVEPCLKNGLSSFADAHFQVSIVRIWRSGGAEEPGPAKVQVGTGEDQVSTANHFTL